MLPCRWQTEIINGEKRKAKTPLTHHGFKDATQNRGQIEAWWEKWPDALIGVPTGKATNLLVIDIDPDGENWYAENFERLGCARVHKTQRGHHLLYRMPAGVDIRISASEIAPGVDVRAEGGYFVWWPASGLSTIGGMDEITEPPAWLLAELLKPAKPSQSQPKANGGVKFGEGQRHAALLSRAGKLRQKGLKGAELEGALHGWNQEFCDPPQDRDEVSRIAQDYSAKDGNDAEPVKVEPVKLLALDLESILQPVPPERYLVVGVPCEAYTLIAGALSSFKTTLLLYMMILRATGYDFLNLDASGIAGNIGPAVLIFYEDTDKRVLAKLHRILQNAYAQIESVHGPRSARAFLASAAKNLRRVAFTGQFHRTIVTRIAGMVLPNELMIQGLLAEVREFASSDVMICIDPLRLAIVGSQNDDDGADVVVHTLNRLAVEVPDSGIVVCSHTTKAGAQEPADGYTGKAYATSGSALYSQHARSNFHVARIKPEEIEKLFDPADVPAEEYARQPVALLTHGRLSHGAESQACYFKMSKNGILVPLKTREPRSAAAISDAHLPIVVSVIEDILAKNRLASETALCTDERLLKTIGNKHKIRNILQLLEADGYVEFTGKTRGRSGTVTTKGRAAAHGTNRDESTEGAQE